jgi:hypothetical protein
MKLTKFALLLLAVIGAGCASHPAALSGSMSALPDCLDANFDAARGLYTMRNAVDLPVNQQCLLTLTAGRYNALVVNGGGGGAGGTVQSTGGGGGGGGGAGAREMQATLDLAAGVYKLTIGAGGPGGDACVPAPFSLGGGPGWAGSPSNIVRFATGELVMGVPGADAYARPSRAQNDRQDPQRNGRGGSGPGQTSGGHGGNAGIQGGAKVDAEAGASMVASAGGAAGAAPGKNNPTGTGGGGGATRLGAGGGGGGQTPDHRNLAPQRGSLGSGGGGGEGHSQGCDAGARGGDGYIALRRSGSGEAS